MRVTLRLPGVRSSSAVSRRCRAPRREGAVRVQRHQSATAAVRPAQQFPAAWPRDLQCRPQDGSSPPPCCPSASEWTRALAWHAPTCPGQRDLGLPLLGGPGGQWGQLGVAGTARLLQLFAGAARHGIATSPPLPECMEAPTMPLSPALVPPRQARYPPPSASPAGQAPKVTVPAIHPLRALLTPHMALPETCCISGLGSPGQVSTQVQPKR